MAIYKGAELIVPKQTTDPVEYFLRHLATLPTNLEGVYAGMKGIKQSRFSERSISALAMGLPSRVQCFVDLPSPALEREVEQLARAVALAKQATGEQFGTHFFGHEGTALTAFRNRFPKAVKLN